MNVWRHFLIIAISITGLLGLAWYFQDSESTSMQQTELTSETESRKSNPSDSFRELELGETSGVTKQTESELSVFFNDPAISQKWDIKKVDAFRAWQVSQGSREIVVAVIDTGADIFHEDLKGNIWQNPGESGPDQNGKDKSKNGIDDDNNGFIDDYSGWNFVQNNSDLTDHHGHGTHIAGIVGALGGNGKGISGIAPKVSMMILKYYDPRAATDNLTNTIKAIEYAIKMNAHIINYSGGGLEPSPLEKAAIEKAEKAGILFIAAAGNEKSNSDRHRYYPADYGLSNIISVTAIDVKTEVLPSSNYGIDTVDLAAPGSNILSTLPGSSYGFMTGTSQATAFVTGAAAVVMAYKGDFHAEEVKKYLLSTGNREESLAQKTGTSRLLNLYKALAVLDQGVGATGVKAANTRNLGAFNTETKKSNDLSTFGNDLMKSVKSNSLGNKNEDPN